MWVLVLPGVIGKERLQYDLWGSPVNLASRLEAASRRGHVLVVDAVAEELSAAYPGVFHFSAMREEELKGVLAVEQC